MSDYTPKISSLREAYLINQVSAAEILGTYDGQTGADAEAQFDRAIEQVRADAKREAFTEAAEWVRDNGGDLVSRGIEDELLARAAGL